MSVDTRPVPTNLLRWPRTRDLISQQKGILMYLWAHPQQTACGCYLLPLDATAADLSMTSGSLADALGEFCRRGLTELDPATGEILLPDWFRFYTPRTPAARGAVEAAINKILSTELRQKTKKSYESMAPTWKGKENSKEKAAATDAAAASKIKTRAQRPSGLVTWLAADVRAAELIEHPHDPATISAAAAAVIVKGKDPVPGLVAKEIEQILQARATAELRADREAAQRAALPGPIDLARGREEIKKARALLPQIQL